MQLNNALDLKIRKGKYVNTDDIWISKKDFAKLYKYGSKIDNILLVLEKEVQIIKDQKQNKKCYESLKSTSNGLMNKIINKFQPSVFENKSK